MLCIPIIAGGAGGRKLGVIYAENDANGTRHGRNGSEVSDDRRQPEDAGDLHIRSQGGPRQLHRPDHRPEWNRQRATGTRRSSFEQWSPAILPPGLTAAAVSSDLPGSEVPQRHIFKGFPKRIGRRGEVGQPLQKNPFHVSSGRSLLIAKHAARKRVGVRHEFFTDHRH